MYTQQKVLVILGFAFNFLTINGQHLNLPNKITVPENTENGTTIFTLKSWGRSYELVNVYPESTSEAFAVEGSGDYYVDIKNGNLIDYEGDHRTYVMRFEEVGVENPDPNHILVIEVQNVDEASDTGSLSSGSSDSSGCCDKVSTIRWMVPVCTAVELLAMIVCSSILLVCFLKKNKRTTVEDFQPGK